jgi:hypothetical protein
MWNALKSRNLVYVSNRFRAFATASSVASLKPLASAR